MVAFLKRIWAKIWSNVWCDHQWRFVDQIEDQDLRSGYKFWSERYICRRCSRIMTREITNWPRR